MLSDFVQPLFLLGIIGGFKVRTWFAQCGVFVFAERVIGFYFNAENIFKFVCNIGYTAKMLVTVVISGNNRTAENYFFL